MYLFPSISSSSLSSSSSSSSLPFLMMWLWISSSFLLVLSGAEKCTPCADKNETIIDADFSLRPGEEEGGYNCTSAIDRAATMEAGSDACLALQLGTYQGSCCSLPPEGYCTLCPDGSSNYNAEKVIPKAALNQREYTCDNIASRNQYIREVEIFESCSATERSEAAAYCECPNAQTPLCPLVCSDGNPPPDMTKTEPVFGKTCERFAYEHYLLVTQEQCSNPTKTLNFDTKAFCCDEINAPENCSICPDGQILDDPNKILQSEHFGEVTCGEIAEHAKYLPGGECKRFMNTLLDIPFGSWSECCIASGAAAVPTTLSFQAMMMMMTMTGVSVLFLLF